MTTTPNKSQASGLIYLDESWSYDRIKETLTANANCQVLFIDGETNRHEIITCTLNPSAIPENAGVPFTPRSEENPVDIRVHNLYVWNLVENTWTKINMNFIIQIKHGE